MLDPEKPKTKNALTHGVYSSEIVLPGESEEDFIELFNAFRGELNPGTALEEEAVLDLTRLHWLKRRVIKAAKRQFGYQQPVSQTSPLEQRELLTSILSFESKLTRFIQAVHKLQTTISDESEFSEDIKRCSEECEFPMHEIAGYKILFKKILTTRTAYDEQSIDYAHEPADLERLVKVETLIDTRIEKTLARIARIKEFGRLYGQKEVVLA